MARGDVMRVVANCWGRDDAELNDQKLTLRSCTLYNGVKALLDRKI